MLDLCKETEHNGVDRYAAIWDGMLEFCFWPWVKYYFLYHREKCLIDHYPVLNDTTTILYLYYMTHKAGTPLFFSAMMINLQYFGKKVLLT